MPESQHSGPYRPYYYNTDLVEIKSDNTEKVQHLISEPKPIIHLVEESPIWKYLLDPRNSIEVKNSPPEFHRINNISV